MESIGLIIRRHRQKKGLTQEELGKSVFVSKQSVSKWENGRSLPDIETVRKLCKILDIDRDEILEGTVKTVRKQRVWLVVCISVTVIFFVMTLFFALDVPGYIDRQMQSGIAYLSVFDNGTLVSADEYTVDTALESKNVVNGYKFDIEYGEIRGIIELPEGRQVEYGFINTNNWHNVQIRLDITNQDGLVTVRQTITYESDDGLSVLENESVSNDDRYVSVFRDGV